MVKHSFSCLDCKARKVGLEFNAAHNRAWLHAKKNRGHRAMTSDLTLYVIPESDVPIDYEQASTQLPGGVSKTSSTGDRTSEARGS